MWWALLTIYLMVGTFIGTMEFFFSCKGIIYSIFSGLLWPIRLGYDFLLWMDWD